MGVNLVYYRIENKDKITDYADLNAQIEAAKETEVDLEKLYSDLAVVLTKSIDFDDLEGEIEYKLIFGNLLFPEIHTDNGQINGFIPFAEVKEIDDWIKKKKLDTEKGFCKYYDKLDDEVKEELESWGSPEKEELFEIFNDVAIMYDLAVKNENSIITCAQ